jgi:hypothetical protein
MDHRGLVDTARPSNADKFLLHAELRAQVT